LTGMMVEDLFPEAVRTDEFFDQPKVFERTAEIPLDKLIGYRETLTLPPSPIDELIEKEEDEEMAEIVSKLDFAQKQAFEEVVIKHRTALEIGKERNVSRGAIYGNLENATRKIKKEIETHRRKERVNALSKGVEL
ncbi:MAG: hypothetical protein AAB866_01545, partial [Patescibacteria group bacterium]